MNKRNFDEIDSEVSILLMDNKYEEAIEIMEAALFDYPEKTGSINLDLAFLYVRTGNFQKSANKVKESLDKGILFPKLYFRRELERDEFKPLIPEWDKLEKEITSKAKPEQLILTPNDYDSSKKYPLFIAIHGWGEDLTLFSKFWKSNKMEQDFIVAMPQSSQMKGSFHFCWDDNELTHKEIKSIYEQVSKEYNIDNERIIVGGFSQGSTVALDIAFNYDYIPVSGVIALNPSKPEVFNEEDLEKAKAKDVKICIITGDKDGDYPAQKEMQAEFEKVGLPYTMSVKENWGHWFPSDLGEKIDSAVDFIL